MIATRWSKVSETFPAAALAACLESNPRSIVVDTNLGILTRFGSISDIGEIQSAARDLSRGSPIYFKRQPLRDAN
jgi:hypothetical protein